MDRDVEVAVAATVDSRFPFITEADLVAVINPRRHLYPQTLALAHPAATTATRTGAVDLLAGTATGWTGDNVDDLS